MAKQTKAQKDTVERVMHAFKQGELRVRGTGPKVKSPKQAIAIALREAGASNQESPEKNRRNLRETKAKEREASKGAKTAAPSRSRRPAGTAQAERTRADLYAEARRRDVPGRSRMSKAELERALRS